MAGATIGLEADGHFHRSISSESCWASSTSIQDNEPVLFKLGMTEEELNSSKLASQIDCKVHHAKTGGIAIDRSARNGKQRHRHRRKDGSYTTAVGDKAMQWPQQ